MAQLVKLTDTLDDTIWVNPDAVMLVEPRYTTNGIQGTQITLQSGREIGVEEKMKMVVEKIGEPVEAVPVVRCKDCKYYKVESGQCPANITGDPFYSWIPDPDWFCADGERRDT